MRRIICLICHNNRVSILTDKNKMNMNIHKQCRKIDFLCWVKIIKNKEETETAKIIEGRKKKLSE